MIPLHYTGNEHASGDRTDVVISRLVAPIIVLAHYVYTFSFNYIPDDIRLNVAGGLALAHAFMALLAVVARPGRWSVLVLVSVFIMGLCWTVSNVAGLGDFDGPEASRNLLPYLMAIWILSYPEAMPRRAICFLTIGAIILGTALAFAGDPLIVGGRSRLAAITSGSDRLHPSAYFVLVNVLILDQLRRSHLVRPVLAWTIIGVGAFVLLQYQVRTTWLMLVIYIISGLYFRDRPNEFHRTLAFLAAGLAFIALFGYLELAGWNIESFSSGRTVAYLHRLDLLANRDPVPFYFGSGPGSDMFATSAWWWAAKGSHNDFLHAFVERGFLGFGGVLLFLFSLNLRLPPRAKGLLWAMIAASAVSNGLLVRPNAIVYIFIAMGLATFHRESSTEQKH